MPARERARPSTTSCPASPSRARRWSHTDHTGAVITRRDYEPYGTPAPNGTGQWGDAPLDGDIGAGQFGYASGYRTVGGLYHFGQRYYDPSDMRWTQPDPLDRLGDLHPDGMFAEKWRLRLGILNNQKASRVHSRVKRIINSQAVRDAKKVGRRVGAAGAVACVGWGVSEGGDAAETANECLNPFAW